MIRQSNNNPILDAREYAFYFVDGEVLEYVKLVLTG
jgi:hypothetical protein